MPKQNTEATAPLYRELRSLKPGQPIFVILRHVSKSGMVRDISPLIFTKGQPRHLYYEAAQALGWSRGKDDESVRVHGCGMDMGFHLVRSMFEACGIKWNQSRNPIRWL